MADYIRALDVIYRNVSFCGNFLEFVNVQFGHLCQGFAGHGLDRGHGFDVHQKKGLLSRAVGSEPNGRDAVDNVKVRLLAP